MIAFLVIRRDLQKVPQIFETLKKNKKVGKTGNRKGVKKAQKEVKLGPEKGEKRVPKEKFSDPTTRNTFTAQESSEYYEQD